MKKFFYTLILLCICGIADAGAQNIASIRERYSTIKDMIAYQQPDKNTNNTSTVTWSQNAPETGPQIYNYTLYFTPVEYNEDGYMKNQKLQFVQSKYNIAASDFYEEYLYDRFENLVFIYTRHPSEDGNATIDTQVYLNQGTILKMTINEVKDGKSKLLYSGKSYNNDPQYMKPTIDKATAFVSMFGTMSKTINSDKQ